MEKFKFNNISGCNWLLNNKKLIVVISHGMAEHIERYDYFANELNKDGVEVWGINQIGHGDAIENNLKGHWEKNGFYQCVENLKTLIEHVHELNKDTKVVLFGHSMGSFLTQEFIKRYSNLIDGVIISGSAKTGALHKMGKFVSSLVIGDRTKPNKFLDGLSFGSYNKQFKPARTPFDWLSRDNEQVDKYIADPLCGYVCTTGFYKEFLKGLAKLNKNVENIRKDLPIYIMSGSKDPVGNNGKDVKALYEMYKNNKIDDVELHLYEDGRHEMLNEINKDEVIKDIKSWLVRFE